MEILYNCDMALAHLLADFFFMWKKIKLSVLSRCYHHVIITNNLATPNKHTISFIHSFATTYLLIACFEFSIMLEVWVKQIDLSPQGCYKNNNYMRLIQFHSPMSSCPNPSANAYGVYAEWNHSPWCSLLGPACGFLYSMSVPYYVVLLLPTAPSCCVSQCIMLSLKGLL